MTAHQKTASDWHDGQSSALYSFVSTNKVYGEKHRAQLEMEIMDCLNYLHTEDGEQQDIIKLKKLHSYIKKVKTS